MMRKLPNSLYLGHASYVCSKVYTNKCIQNFTPDMIIVVFLYQVYDTATIPGKGESVLQGVYRSIRKT